MVRHGEQLTTTSTPQSGGYKTSEEAKNMAHSGIAREQLSSDLPALTTRQLQILRFIKSFATDNGRPPYISEICESFGFRGKRAAEDHVNRLIRKGYCKRDKKKHNRPLVVTV